MMRGAGAEGSVWGAGLIWVAAVAYSGSCGDRGTMRAMGVTSTQHIRRPLAQIAGSEQVPSLVFRRRVTMFISPPAVRSDLSRPQNEPGASFHT